jgi:hypothetical protein
MSREQGRGPRAEGRGSGAENGGERGHEDSLGPQPSALGPDDPTRWGRLYTTVLLALAVEVALFYWLTRSFE